MIIKLLQAHTGNRWRIVTEVMVLQDYTVMRSQHRRPCQQEYQ
jgi:hypothetical protein